MWILFPVFKFQINKYVILDTETANKFFFIHLIAHVSVQNYADSQLNLIRSICCITLVASNIDSVQFYWKTKNISMFTDAALFAICKYLVIIPGNGTHNVMCNLPDYWSFEIWLTIIVKQFYSFLYKLATRGDLQEISFKLFSHFSNLGMVFRTSRQSWQLWNPGWLEAFIHSIVR